MFDPTTLTPEQLKRFEERFWSKIDRTGGPDACWPWRGLLDKDGYGWTYARRRNFRTHVVAYRLKRGYVQADLCVCHSCDVRYPVGDISYRRCCNPNHLWLGTSLENRQDCKRKGRTAKGARSPSRMHPESLLRGKNHPRHTKPERWSHIGSYARWTRGEMDEIRRRLSSGETDASMALELGVSRRTVQKIRERRHRNVRDERQATS